MPMFKFKREEVMMLLEKSKKLLKIYSLQNLHCIEKEKIF